MGERITFAIAAAVALGSAVGVVTLKNPFRAAVSLIGTLLAVAVMFLLLAAPFVAAIQIIVYAGAIVVLFLFVIMLLGAERLRSAADDVRGPERFHRYAALVLALVLVGVFGYVLFQGGGANGATTGAMIDASPQALGLALFQSYVFPFQVTGVLLLAAITGVVIFGHTKRRGGDNA